MKYTLSVIDELMFQSEKSIFSRFKSYFDLGKMDAYDQFCNKMKVDKVKLLSNYIN